MAGPNFVEHVTSGGRGHRPDVAGQPHRSEPMGIQGDASGPDIEQVLPLLVGDAYPDRFETRVMERKPGS